MAAKKKKKPASTAPTKKRVATKTPAKTRAKKKAHASGSVARKTRRNPEECHAEANPAHHAKKKKGKRKRKKNPAPGELSPIARAAVAVGLGVSAAVVGTLGDWGISKLGIQSKAAGIAANMGAAVVGGTGLGAILPYAGMIVAHNFTTSAVQIALSKPRPEPAAKVENTSARISGGVSPNLLKASAPVGNYEQIAAEIASEHERLSGIVADTMGDQVRGYEPIGTVRADMGDDALSRIQSVHAAYAGDDFGDPEEIGNLDYITA